MKASKPLNAIPPDLVSLADYERLAREMIRFDIFEYIAGGVANDLTLKRNQSAFDGIHLNPQVLMDFSGASTATTLLGQTVKHPILLAPVAYQALVHPDAELASVAAANAVDTGFIASTLSSVSLEDIAKHCQQLKWFQLYFQPHSDDTLALVRRAEHSGYGALVVTVDAPVSGLRQRAQRAGFSLPAGSAANLQQQQPPAQTILNPGDSIILNGMMSEAPTWQAIEWLMQRTDLPIILKGIINPGDAQRAINAGAAAIVVSNHGGRTLDGLPASIEALPKIRDAVGPQYPLLLDSGIRRGSDVFKALALGANAVLVGRPQLYALAVAGALGVAHMLKLLRDEFEITMALTGCKSIADIGPHCLWS